MIALTVPRLHPLNILARAEKRLTSHIATHGIDDTALLICATCERLYVQSVAPSEWSDAALSSSPVWKSSVWGMTRRPGPLRERV